MCHMARCGRAATPAAAPHPLLPLLPLSLLPLQRLSSPLPLPAVLTVGDGCVQAGGWVGVRGEVVRWLGEWAGAGAARLPEASEDGALSAIWGRSRPDQLPLHQRGRVANRKQARLDDRTVGGGAEVAHPAPAGCTCLQRTSRKEQARERRHRKGGKGANVSARACLPVNEGGDACIRLTHSPHPSPPGC